MYLYTQKMDDLKYKLYEIKSKLSRLETNRFKIRHEFLTNLHPLDLHLVIKQHLPNSNKIEVQPQGLAPKPAVCEDDEVGCGFIEL